LGSHTCSGQMKKKEGRRMKYEKEIISQIKAIINLQDRIINLMEKTNERVTNLENTVFFNKKEVKK
jgi:hypothetical protein